MEYHTILERTWLWICLSVSLLRFVFRLYTVKQGNNIRKIKLIFLTMFLESLEVVRDMGVQLTTKYFSGLEKHKFIEKEKIRNVIVNEGIKFGDIKFYLAFVIRSSDEMIIAFEVRQIRSIFLSST